MSLTLNNLKSFAALRKKKKRIGRGDGSGHGTYSTRGLKGQKSRSGSRKGLKRMGLKTYLRKLPKTGGFRSLSAKMSVVNVKDLEKKFTDKETITKKELLSNGLIKDSNADLKILGYGKLTKKFTVIADAFSVSAKQAIIKAGGEAKLTASVPKDEKKQIKTAK